MRVEKSPPLVIHGEQPKDFFFFFSPVGRAACSKDNVSPSGRQSPSKVTNSSWIVGSSMDRRSIDLVFARNDEPPPSSFLSSPSSFSHHTPLLSSSFFLVRFVPGLCRPRKVGSDFRDRTDRQCEHTLVHRLRKSSSLFSHSKIFSLLSPPLCLSLPLTLYFRG